ncbi:MAG: hypothetical protein ABSE18_03300 [Minisyncoccia bacterium]|jgi:hypothetical protein
MAQSDGYNNDFTDKASASSDGAIEEKEDWLNEHGQPDFEYLQSLATNGSPGALEKLRSIAEDLNVEYDPSTSTEELIGRIRSATERNEDGGPDATT